MKVNLGISECSLGREKSTVSCILSMTGKYSFCLSLIKYLSRQSVPGTVLNAKDYKLSKTEALT